MCGATRYVRYGPKRTSVISAALELRHARWRDRFDSPIAFVRAAPAYRYAVVILLSH